MVRRVPPPVAASFRGPIIHVPAIAGFVNHVNVPWADPV